MNTTFELLSSLFTNINPIIHDISGLKLTIEDARSVYLQCKKSGMNLTKCDDTANLFNFKTAFYVSGDHNLLLLVGDDYGEVQLLPNNHSNIHYKYESIDGELKWKSFAANLYIILKCLGNYEFIYFGDDAIFVVVSKNIFYIINGSSLTKQDFDALPKFDYEITKIINDNSEKVINNSTYTQYRKI